MDLSDDISKEKLASQGILQLIQGDAFPIGARLPSERKLAEKLGTSRNTLRSALRQLQAHGIVEIRSGSGNYVRSKDLPVSLASRVPQPQPRASMAETMEARLMVEPVIGAQAAVSATTADIEGLEGCLMRMSRASIDNLYDQMICEDRQFRKLLAQSCQNRLVVSLHERIAGQEDASLLGTHLPEADKASLFADYVGIFTAIQQHAPERAHTVIRQHILRQCRLMAERLDISLPAAVEEGLRRWNQDQDHEKHPAQAKE